MKKETGIGSFGQVTMMKRKNHFGLFMDFLHKRLKYEVHRTTSNNQLFISSWCFTSTRVSCASRNTWLYRNRNYRSQYTCRNCSCTCSSKKGRYQNYCWM